MSHWSFGASFLLVLTAIAAWLGAAWLGYANWQRRGGGRKIALLEGLRLVIMTLLAFTLLRPEYVQQIQRTEMPEVAVLWDASGSMATRDLKNGTNILSRAEWLQQQRDSGFWKPLEKTAKVTVEDFSAPAKEPKPEDGTDLNQALENVLNRQKNLKAVVLLTDGDWNLGKSPVGIATRYREQNIPIFSVGVGRETPMPDLVLEKASAPSYGLVGEQISIPFKIRSYLPHEVKTVVTLVDTNGEELKKEILIPAQGELQDAIVWSPQLIGEFDLKLKLPVQPEETLTDNNEQSLRVAVRSEQLKVLVVDSVPRWEYRYLRNALARDPGVDMQCLLYQPGMEPGGGRNYIPAFPGTKEQLSKYDVIFLGDVGIGDHELTAADVDLIKGLVEQQASGLVFLPGRQGKQMSLLHTPLKDLVPVVMDETKPGGVGLQNESALILSSLGAGHLLTRFDSEESRNESIWKNLPGFYWSAAVEKSRPGSEVLAVHSSLRNSWGRIPLLVTRSYGSGKVLFMGMDSAWRWRRGVEDKYHYRFWSQVVRWMAHQRHLSERQGIRLTYSPETPRVGDTIFFQSTVLNNGGYPIDKGPVLGKITSPSGRVERFELTPVEGGWGVFKTSFAPSQGGKYKVQITAEQYGRQLDTEVEVTQPQREILGQPANYQILRDLAGLTHGESAGYDGLKQIVQQVSLLPEPKPIELRLRLWANPWWGGLILLLLGIYWTARKLAGMV